MNNNTSVKKLFGGLIKIVLAIVVFAFLGLKSIDFFLFTTPPEKWYLAYFGFGLTGGGVIGYLIILMWDADTVLKRFISILMLAVCVIGELTTAGFGLQIEAWKKSGLALAQTDFDAMVLAVQLLGFAHAGALIAYYAGDTIAKAFRDDNKNGIPDWLEKKQNNQNQKQQNQPQRVFANPPEDVPSLTQKRPENERGDEKGNPDRPNQNGR
jgi:hypothetical protein